MGTARAPSVLFEPSGVAASEGLKVLVVTNMYPHPARPSHGIFVREQVQSLRMMGVRADVLFINGPAGKVNYGKGLLAFWRHMRRARYDLVHGHYVYGGAIARLQAGCPVLSTFHGGEFYMGRLEPLLCRLLAPRVDGVILTSSALRGCLPDQQAWILPCGVDSVRFRPMPRDPARAELGLPMDKKLVLFVAARRPEKRLDLVEQAVSVLNETVPEAELIVLSDQPPDRVPLYMNAADVLVLASNNEGSPQVVKEAMACNLPIVSVPVGDVPEVLADVAGCYLCSQSPPDIADKLGMALRREERTTGRDAIAHLSLEAVAARLVDIYREVLERRSSVRSRLGQPGGSLR